MGVVGNIITRVGADIRPLQKSLGQAAQSIGQFANKVEGGSKSIGSDLSRMAGGFGLAKIGMIGLATTAAAAFAGIAKATTKAAMNAVESENLFTVSMGNMAGAARMWANDLQKSLGLNAYEIRKNVGTFYNMTTSMGLAQSQAYDLSTSLTKLAYDMSSFYNMNFEDAFIKLTAGISGETEPLKRLGIIVTENALKQQALNMGIRQSVTTMNEAQKVMLRYNAIMAQTKNAQGDLARTLTSPLNQLRLIKTQFELISINIGNAFLPILQKITPVILNMAMALEKVTSVFAQFMTALFGTQKAQAQAQAQTASTTKTVVQENNNLAKSIDKTTKKAKGGVMAFDEVNQLQEQMADSAADASDAFSIGGNEPTATTPTPVKYESTIEIPKWMQDAIDKFKKEFEPALKEGKEAITALKDAFKSVGEALDILKLPQLFLDLLDVGFKSGMMIAAGVMKEVAGSIMTVAGAVKGIATGDWETFKKGLNLIAEGKVDQINGVKLAIDGTIVAIGTWGEKLEENGKKNKDTNVILNEGKGVWGTVTDVVNKNSEAAKTNTREVNAQNGAFTTGKGAWSTVTGVIKDNTTTVDTSTKATNSNKGAWSTVTETVGKAGTSYATAKTNITKEQNEIDTNTKTVWDNVTKSLTTAWDFVKAPFVVGFETARTAIIATWQTIAEKAKYWWDLILTHIKVAWTWVKDTLSSAFETTKKKIIDGWITINKNAKYYWDLITEPIKTAWNWVKDSLTKPFEATKKTIIEGWKTIKANAVSIWNGIVSAITTAVTDIVNGINTVITTLNSLTGLKVPTIELNKDSKSGGGGGGGVIKSGNALSNLIPKFGTGGIVTSPTVGMIGEAGTEAIVPLENSGFIENLASAVTTGFMQALQFTQSTTQKGNTELVLKINDREMGRVMLPTLINEAQRQGGQIVFQGA